MVFNNIVASSYNDEEVVRGDESKGLAPKEANGHLREPQPKGGTPGNEDEGEDPEDALSLLEKLREASASGAGLNLDEFVTTPEPAMVGTSSDFSIKDCLVDQSIGDKPLEEKLVTSVTVGRPDSLEYCYLFKTLVSELVFRVIEVKENGRKELLLLSKNVRCEVGRAAKEKILVPCITREGVLHLWPVRHVRAGESVDSWTRSAMKTVDEYCDRWIRIEANPAARSYEAYSPGAIWDAPEFPEKGYMWMVETAFEGKIISDSDHPVLRKLRGED